MPVLMLVFRSQTFRGLVQERFEERFEEQDEEKYIRWIGRDRVIYGEKMTNGLAVWDLIVQEICSDV